MGSNPPIKKKNISDWLAKQNPTLCSTIYRGTTEK